MSIITEQFQKTLKKFESFSPEDFEKLFQFCVQEITETSSSKTRLGEIIEVLEDEEQVVLSKAKSIVLQLSQVNYSDRSLQNVLDILGTEPAYSAILYKIMTENRSELRHKIKMTNNQSQYLYKDFDWRFDIQVASRAAPEEFIPKIFCALTLENPMPSIQKKEDGTGLAGGKGKLREEKLIFETDLATLKHFNETITNALKAGETISAKKILNYVK